MGEVLEMERTYTYQAMKKLEVMAQTYLERAEKVEQGGQPADLMNALKLRLHHQTAEAAAKLIKGDADAELGALASIEGLAQATLDLVEQVSQRQAYGRITQSAHYALCGVREALAAIVEYARKGAYADVATYILEKTGAFYKLRSDSIEERAREEAVSVGMEHTCSLCGEKLAAGKWAWQKVRAGEKPLCLRCKTQVTEPYRNTLAHIIADLKDTSHKPHTNELINNLDRLAARMAREEVPLTNEEG